MAKYLVTVSYTAEGAKGVRKDGGTKRRKVAGKAVESVGGKLESFYFSFGAQDALVIVDIPDNVSAAALSLAINASGGCARDHHSPSERRGDGQGQRQEDRLQGARRVRATCSGGRP